ncbi:hypothetical protein B0H11DRAFT_2258750 [Mycena galericulata]|nr:hypothetical protein B0H11DRAFT_2258750 [Mycena galericulata]
MREEEQCETPKLETDSDVATSAMLPPPSPPQPAMQKTTSADIVEHRPENNTMQETDSDVATSAMLPPPSPPQPAMQKTTSADIVEHRPENNTRSTPPPADSPVVTSAEIADRRPPAPPQPQSADADTNADVVREGIPPVPPVQEDQEMPPAPPGEESDIDTLIADLDAVLDGMATAPTEQKSAEADSDTPREDVPAARTEQASQIQDQDMPAAPTEQKSADADADTPREDVPAPPAVHDSADVPVVNPNPVAPLAVPPRVQKLDLSQFTSGARRAAPRARPAKVMLTYDELVAQMVERGTRPPTPPHDDDEPGVLFGDEDESGVHLGASPPPQQDRPSSPLAPSPPSTSAHHHQAASPLRRSPLPSPLPPSSPPGAHEDEDDHPESDGNASDDSYSATAAAKEKAFKRDHETFSGMKDALLQEEEDQLDEDEFEREAAGDKELGTKKKGGKQVQKKRQEPVRSKIKAKGHPAADGDEEDEEGEGNDAGPYKSGPLDKPTQNLLLSWKEELSVKVEDLARQVKKPSTLLWSIVNGEPKGLRRTSAWNKFQRWLYAETGGNRVHDKDVSREERGKLDRAEYEKYLAPHGLTREEMSNTDIVLEKLPWLAEWDDKFHEAVLASIQADGSNERSMTSIGREMSKISEWGWKDRKVHIVGYIISTDGGSKSFGASPAAKLFKERNPLQAKATIREYESRFHVLELEMAGASAAALLQSKKSQQMEWPSRTEYATGEKRRDAGRKFVKDCLIADIVAILVERDGLSAEEALSLPIQMKWSAWADMAWEHKVRIENWDVDMANRGHYPKKGFQIQHFSIKDLERLVPNLEARHGAPPLEDEADNEDDEEERDEPDEPDAESSLRVVSWTEEEREFTLSEQRGVALIETASGSVLCVVEDSAKWKGALKKEKLKTQKAELKVAKKSKAKIATTRGRPSTRSRTPSQSASPPPRPPRRARDSRSPARHLVHRAEPLTPVHVRLPTHPAALPMSASAVLGAPCHRAEPPTPVRVRLPAQPAALPMSASAEDMDGAAAHSRSKASTSTIPYRRPRSEARDGDGSARGHGVASSTHARPAADGEPLAKKRRTEGLSKSEKAELRKTAAVYLAEDEQPVEATKEHKFKLVSGDNCSVSFRGRLVRATAPATTAERALYLYEADIGDYLPIQRGWTCQLEGEQLQRYVKAVTRLGLED